MVSICTRTCGDLYFGYLKTMDIADLRQEYTQEQLDKSNLDSDPYAQFEKWFGQALKSEVQEPNAMVLATSNSENQPFTRTVLLKKMDSKGFVFFTNYESRKATQIAMNAKVSALFLWLPLERQVSINGTVERIPQKESLSYFTSRPLSSQIGAWASKQSSIISSRSILEGKWNEVKEKFAQGKIPLPSFWGGYRIIPHSFEFWQGRKSRLHDRFLYSKNGDNWSVDRLSP